MEIVHVNCLLYLFITCIYINSFFFVLFLFLSYDKIISIQILVYKKHGPNRWFAASILLKIRHIASHSEDPVRIFSLCLFPLQQTFGQNRLYAWFIQSTKVPCNKIVQRCPFEQCHWLYFNESCRTIRNFSPKTVASDFRYLCYVEI